MSATRELNPLLRMFIFKGYLFFLCALSLIIDIEFHLPFYQAVDSANLS